jgi:hypothetical protein
MINPNMFMYDDGRAEDAGQQTGLGIQMMGREQNRQRRAAEQEKNWQRMMQPGQGPLVGLSHGLGLGGSPGWDGYFGAMQGKENAAAAQGGQMDFDLNSWGPQESSVSWDKRFRTPVTIQGLKNAGLRWGNM